MMPSDREPLTGWELLGAALAIGATIAGAVGVAWAIGAAATWIGRALT